jgi:hypothetical protein
MTDGATLGGSGGGRGAATPHDRVRRADAESAARLETAVTDALLAEDGRLDERTRAAVQARLAALVAGIADRLRTAAARALAAEGRADAAEALLRRTDGIGDRLAAAGLLGRSLVAEVIAETRLAQLADGMAAAPGEADAPSLLVRLADCPDAEVAQAARALLVAENRGAALPADELDALCWGVAAVLADSDTDAALAAAAARLIAAHDEGAGASAAAVRLAQAIDARPAELAEVLEAALGDRRPRLFAALCAHAAGLAFADVRALLLDPEDDRLWLLLRGLDLPRAVLAAVAVALAEGDPRRDLERFADALDGLAAIAPDDAAAAIADLRLPVAFRHARRAVGRAA